MTGVPQPGVRDLPLDPDLRVARPSSSVTNRRGELADGEDASLGPPARPVGPDGSRVVEGKPVPVGHDAVVGTRVSALDVLARQADPLDAVGQAGGRVDVDHHTVQPGLSRRGAEAGRHPVDEPPQHRLDLDTDDGVVRPGHAHVGDVGRARGQHPLVRGLHVGVGAHDGGDLSVEVPAHRELLRGRLRVEVDQDDRGSLLPDRLDLLLDHRERIVERDHEDPPHDVDDADGDVPGARAGDVVATRPGASG